MRPSLIFDIKRYAINDGPGIRITVFFKGCPLSCTWCHNPESKHKEVQKMYTESKCIGSLECVNICEQDALRLTPSGIVTDIEKCNLCGDCADHCPTKAIEMSGEEMTVGQIMSIIKRETLFMDQSEGGVTFSGGEPLMHHQLLLQLLKECGKEGIHRCVDTTGFANTNVLKEIALHTDHFLYDLKMMDSEKHKNHTGVPNEKILENLQVLANSGSKINIRIPLIEGINDDDENIIKTASFVADLKGENKHINLLPYHNIAINKYQKLGLDFEEEEMHPPHVARLDWIIRTFESYGLNASIGG